jgi:hypothetical protein
MCAEINAGEVEEGLLTRKGGGKGIKPQPQKQGKFGKRNRLTSNSFFSSSPVLISSGFLLAEPSQPWWEPKWGGPQRLASKAGYMTRREKVRELGEVQTVQSQCKVLVCTTTFCFIEINYYSA